MDPTTQRMFTGAAAATAPPVEITFSANTYNLSANQTSTLSWNVLNSASVSINYLGSVNASGSQGVTGSGETKTFVLSALGLDGINYSSSISISWGVPYPVINAFVIEGSYFYWATINATSIYLSGVGNVAASGSYAYPTSSHLGGYVTYTLTASGSGISVSESITYYQQVDCQWALMGYPEWC